MSPPANDPHSTAARLNKLLHELDRQTAAASDLQEMVNKGLVETHTDHALDEAARAAGPAGDDRVEADTEEPD